MSVLWPSILAASLVLQYAALLILTRFNWKSYAMKSPEYPRISILVAARNEEEDLPHLLKSLEGLDYPEDSYEILIADDNSSDQTALLIEKWAEGKSNRRLVSITKDDLGMYHSNGKANALAILAKQASGDLFFFTDADCELPPTWLKEGVASFDKGVGLVIGVTQVKSASLLGKMQELEWWNTLGIVKAVTDLELPTTGLGNNMAISKQAYIQSGGFEGISYSVTEDLEISRSIRRSGFTIRHQVSPGLLVKTKAEKSWGALLRQRKRWVTGAMTLSFGWKVLLGFQFLFFPLIISILMTNGLLGIAIWGFKVIFQSWFLLYFAGKSGQRIGLLPLIMFDFYQMLSLSLTILYYFWPVRVQWKSRNYP